MSRPSRAISLSAVQDRSGLPRHTTSQEGIVPRGRLRWADLANVAGAVTTGRLIIAVIFPLLLHNPRLALGAYIAALLSDVLDGALARHTGTVSHTGALLDGWVDKILHINGAWAMALHGLMPGWWMWLWFTREIVQWLMFPVLLHDVRNGRVRTYTTSLAGRITAVLLAAAFILTLLGLPTAALWVSFAVAPAGFLTATGYLKHALDDRKRLR